MGGKSSQPAPPAPAYPDYGAQLGQMMAMFMTMQQNMMAAIPQQPVLPETPDLSVLDDVDWKEKQDELLAKASIDFNAEKEGKKGRVDTILTSPLLDDEDPETTKGSLLTGVPTAATQ